MYDVQKAHECFLKLQALEISGLQKDEKGDQQFWVKDKYDNHFNVVTGNLWFKQTKEVIGGVTGATIGVTDMDRSLRFYTSLLNTDDVVYDYTGEALNGPRNEKRKYRKVLLQKHRWLHLPKSSC